MPLLDYNLESDDIDPDDNNFEEDDTRSIVTLHDVFETFIESGTGPTLSDLQDKVAGLLAKYGYGSDAYVDFILSNDDIIVKILHQHINPNAILAAKENALSPVFDDNDELGQIKTRTADLLNRR